LGENKVDAILSALREKAGIVFMGVDPALQLPEAAASVTIAQDAQPSLVTVSNSGIPAFLSTFIDPKLIEILVAPMKAAEIVGDEIKKGDWTTETAMFPVVESTGETSSYGDYSENGAAGANTNFPQRQSYHYQVMTQWGERELDKAALARIDWANRVNIASVLTLNKFQNKSYFFGVAGLQNYGLLNDPALSAPITPAVKTAGGTGGTKATGLEVYADIQAIYKQLQTQANGLVELDTAMTLSMSPTSEVALTKVTEFNVNVMDMIKKNFPNLKVKTAPEYSTDSGELVQLMADEIQGQRTASVAFTEKLRAHPIIVQSSSFKQKKSQGTWGGIIFRSFLIAQMLGV
jgi:hypothetical protein